MLETVALFASLEPEQLAAIEKYAVVRRYPKNTVILCEGDHSDSLYVILSGKVKVYLNDENGKEVIINYQGEGEYFGELSLIDDSERSASIVTAAATTFAVISKAAFFEALLGYPEIGIQLIGDLVRRIRTLTGDIKTLALSDVYGRLCKLLIDLARPEDGRQIVSEPLTQQEIANRIGASREMVCRILKDLETGGYITQDRKQLIIHKALPRRY